MRALVIVIAAAAILVASSGGAAAQAQVGPENVAKVKEFRIERGMSKEAVACIQCHKAESPGLFADWAMSRHASANITCIDCHRADPNDPDVIKSHFKQYERSDTKWGIPEYKTPIAGAVSPKDCSRCHPDEVKQYSLSKHANTLEVIWKIDVWLNGGLNNATERNTGCFVCHGTVLSLDDKGNYAAGTWPNTGVGRYNMDGSLGSCTSCHTRHRFSVMDARKPEACGQCHLGPDHPQIEIYTESKHGDIYAAFGESYNWTAAPGTWTPGVDYRGPTCASCHMSGAGGVMTTHDVTERLSWESQAPLTVRPQDFAAFPAKTDWKVERAKMQEICNQCHSKTWTEAHYAKIDEAVQNYNEVYFKPAKALMDQLYEKGILDKKGLMDEPIEWEYYELWHHEGRRARMGSQMMAPDYAWWHGFYECKHRFNEVSDMARELLEAGKPGHKWLPFPGAGGSTEKPPEIFGKK